MLHASAPSGSLELWHTRQWALCDQPQLGPWPWVSAGPPQAGMSHPSHCIAIAGGRLCTLTPRGRERAHRNLRQTPPDSTWVLVPDNSAVYPYCVSLLSLSHQHDCMLSSVNSASQCLSVGVVLRTRYILLSQCVVATM